MLTGSAGSAFPLSAPYHYSFCIIAVIFLLYRFIKYKKPYQLIFAAAVPLSLLTRIESLSSDMYMYIGIAEIILTIAALVFIIKDAAAEFVRKRRSRKLQEAEQQI